MKLLLGSMLVLIAMGIPVVFAIAAIAQRRVVGVDSQRGAPVRRL